MEAMCWADTLVHPIEGEDHGIGLIRFENGAIGQFEVSWAFRGGMDLRDEVSGSEGTIWLNHWLRTGYEMFTASGQGGYVAEKAEGDRGWVFPVGDEAAELGYTEMFKDMFNSMDSKQTPIETFYDGYVVNAIIDTCYISARSKQWEPVQLDVWQGDEQVQHIRTMEEIDGMILIKTEVMPDGKTKQILKDPESGTISEKIL
jgi:predicted dehydrogenase